MLSISLTSFLAGWWQTIVANAVQGSDVSSWAEGMPAMILPQKLPGVFSSCCKGAIKI